MNSVAETRSAAAEEGLVINRKKTASAAALWHHNSYQFREVITEVEDYKYLELN